MPLAQMKKSEILQLFHPLLYCGSNRLTMKYAALFIALLFVGCGEALPTLDGGETITISGKTIQVAKEDFPESMNWYEAMEACEGLGNGWRLPTKEELLNMYVRLHTQGMGNFKNDWYWSGSLDDNSDYACYVAFNHEIVDCYYKSSYYQVRAVRTLP